MPVRTARACVCSSQSVLEICHASNGSTRIPCINTAWTGFSHPPVAYARCGSPPNTSRMPVAIITPPTICAPTRATNPARIARRRPGGNAVPARNAATVSATMIATSVNPPTASVWATAASNGVSTLKCDGTPRHACSDTRNVSRTHAAAKTPSSNVRVRSLRGMNEAMSVTLTNVRPKERPNVVGLAQRHWSFPGAAADQKDGKVDRRRSGSAGRRPSRRRALRLSHPSPGPGGWR